MLLWSCVLILPANKATAQYIDTIVIERTTLDSLIGSLGCPSELFNEAGTTRAQ